MDTWRLNTVMIGAERPRFILEGFRGAAEKAFPESIPLDRHVAFLHQQKCLKPFGMDPGSWSLRFLGRDDETEMPARISVQG